MYRDPFDQMRASIKRSNNRSRRKHEAMQRETLQVLTGDAVNSVLRSVEDVIADHLPPSEFRPDATHTRFTLAEIFSDGEATESEMVIARGLLKCAEKVGAVRSDGVDTWCGVDYDRMDTDDRAFTVAVSHLKTELSAMQIAA